MARNFQWNGPTMIMVKGTGALQDPNASEPGTPMLWELGLAQGVVTVSPKFYHKDIMIDDFGPEVPVEVLSMLALVDIDMTMIHVDLDVLYKCVLNSMAVPNGPVGAFSGAGTPLGGNTDATTDYISLNLTSPVLARPLRFRAAYLAVNPFEMPLGVKAMPIPLKWRAIPYKRLKWTVAGQATDDDAILNNGQTIVNGAVVPNGMVAVYEMKSNQTVLWDSTLDT